jgi:hypothetical protein
VESIACLCIDIVNLGTIHEILDKESFKELDLSRIDKQVCLRGLSAKVSPRYDERLPVKPIIEFDG